MLFPLFGTSAYRKDGRHRITNMCRSINRERFDSSNIHLKMQKDLQKGAKYTDCIALAMHCQDRKKRASIFKLLLG